MLSPPARLVHHADAIAWLEASPVREGCSFVASLPDFTEFPSLTLGEWKAWFTRAANLIMSRTPGAGVSIFYQRDAKHEGLWIDKSYLIQRAAEAVGAHLLWRKVVCRAPAGQVTFGKPAYSHLLCFSKELRLPLAHSVADVLPEPGRVTWARGMGTRACELACRFVLEETSTCTIVDPFCGHGTVLAVANAMGLSAEGVELSRKRAERARALTYAGATLRG